jgi:hypothetical protein
MFYSKNGEIVLSVGHWYNRPYSYFGNDAGSKTLTVHLEDGERVIGYKSRTSPKESNYISWYDEQLRTSPRNRNPDDAYHCDF